VRSRAESSIVTKNEKDKAQGLVFFYERSGGTFEDALITSYELPFNEARNGAIGEQASETKAELLAA